jgi:hypothetical protein
MSLKGRWTVAFSALNCEGRFLGTSKYVEFASFVTEHKHCLLQRLLERRDCVIDVCARDCWSAETVLFLFASDTAGVQRLFYFCLRQRLLKIRECALVVATETDEVQRLIPCETAEVCALVV